MFIPEVEKKEYKKTTMASIVEKMVSYYKDVHSKDREIELGVTTFR